MKTFVLSLLCLMSVMSLAQTAMAPLSINVTDFQNKPRKGEQIWFQAKKTGKVYKGVSGTDGKFKMEIPGGDTYLIKIKSVGEADDYSSIEVPALQEGQRYGEMMLTIQIEIPKSFTLNNVNFDTGKSSLRSSSYKELNEVAELMKYKPEMKMRIEGHTDNVGDPESNMKLSKARAEAVKNYLIKKGISADRLSSEGFGSTRPVALNDTAAGRQKNRRTEVHVVE